MLTGAEEVDFDSAGGAAELSNGYFVEPTILADVPLTSTCWTDEIFGPVLAIRTFSTEEEAVAMANDSPYGLAHSVMSADKKRCTRVASQKPPRQRDVGPPSAAVYSEWSDAPYSHRQRAGMPHERSFHAPAAPPRYACRRSCAQSSSVPPVSRQLSGAYGAQLE